MESKGSRVFPIIVEFGRVEVQRFRDFPAISAFGIVEFCSDSRYITTALLACTTQENGEMGLLMMRTVSYLGVEAHQSRERSSWVVLICLSFLAFSRLLSLLFI